MNHLKAIVGILAFTAYVAGEKKISASPGGGVLKVGEDLVLTYDVGEVWDRCYWFWYHNDQDHAQCSFEMDPATGVAKLRSCKPEGVQTTMTYTGTEKTKCEVTVSKVTEKENATFAARLGEDIKRMEVNVIVAKEPTKVEVTAKEGQEGDKVTVKAGTEAEINCNIDGVRPQPSFGISVQDVPEEQMLGKANSTTLVNGAFNVIQTMKFKPSIVDHGKTVACKAALTDADGKALFDEPKTAQPLTLNVLFPPEEKSKQTINVPENTSAIISFVFKANPAPTEVKWVIAELKSEDNATEKPTEGAESRAEDGPKDTTVLPGVNNTKYIASKVITDKDSPLAYRYNLTIIGVTEEDTQKSYKLEVTNGIGETVAYDFTIENGNGFFPSNLEPSSTGTLFTLLGIAALIVIALGVVSYIKKRRGNAAETAPLTR